MQFCIFENKICTFDPETGSKEVIADNFEQWAKCILEDYDFLTGFPFAHDWQSQNGSIPIRSRLLPKIPFVCGGEYRLDNLYLSESAEGMRIRANIAQQIKNLRDGTKIKLNIEIK